MSGKALLPGFGDDEDDNEEQITATVTEVHGLFKEAQGHLKAISNATDTSNNGDDEVRLNIQQRVAKQLQDLQLDFNKSHRAYIAKLKGQTIEEYRPKVEFNNPAASSSTTFFEDEPEVVDPRCATRTPRRSPPPPPPGLPRRRARGRGHGGARPG